MPMQGEAIAGYLWGNNSPFPGSQGPRSQYNTPVSYPAVALAPAGADLPRIGCPWCPYCRWPRACVDSHTGFDILTLTLTLILTLYSIVTLALTPYRAILAGLGRACRGVSGGGLHTHHTDGRSLHGRVWCIMVGEDRVGYGIVVEGAIMQMN